ncbi:type II toxin-antitoxin system RelE family toxin [Thioflexithrix psekupsensis]|uniref:Plasmid stabilization protein n=1 Tax=Thioflexithrix psekupsensis TaxID=1570016 RepID=A0A251X482_9GAMM|nr:type II toxin-antitoxin system RelE/ParE family toxin [Thioflexithrix psekupsensis]OUD12196.1 plasmid stabilization protein [Thioflexithrix psekupsensis]
MKVHFERRFLRDIHKIKDRLLRVQIEEIIDQVKQAESLNDINNLKKLQGYDTFYRIRWRDYRIGIQHINDEIIFVRVLHRRDVYYYFP